MKNLHNETDIQLNTIQKQLTIKQEKFVLKYFECGNATEAYKYAYSTKKMKDKTIIECASRLLSDRNITTRLEELRAKAEAESQFTVAKLIDIHAEIINIGLGKQEAKRTVIEGTGKGYTQAVEVETKNVDLASAKASAVEIAKLLGFYEKDNGQKGGIDLGAIAKEVFESQRGN